MKGHFLHNNVLVELPALALERLGASVKREYPIRDGRHSPSVDAYVEFEGYRIVIEAERADARRSCNDVLKAKALDAHVLCIAVPTMRVARRVLWQLHGCEHLNEGEKLKIVVLPLGALLHLLRNKSALMSALNVMLTSIQQIQTTPRLGNKPKGHL